MRPDERDAAALQDMLERGDRAIEKLADLTFEQFLDDQDSQDIVVHCLEVLGEAAGRVSPAGRDSHRGVPWRQVIAMRNRLIHDYGNVDLEAVWLTVREDLPPLLESIRQNSR